MLASELGQLQAETRSLTARAGRLEREGTGEGAACTTGGPECAQEQALAAVHQSALRSKQDALSAQAEQRRRELGEAQATIEHLRGRGQTAGTTAETRHQCTATPINTPPHRTK